MSETFVAFIGVREEAGVPRAVVISGNDPQYFTVMAPGHRWRSVAQIHSRRSYERAAAFARVVLREEFPKLAPLEARP
jgi:hypothetical protein